jgi:hypothetical protein
MAIGRDFTGATGLEPATSGVTGRLRRNRPRPAAPGTACVVGVMPKATTHRMRLRGGNDTALLPLRKAKCRFHAQAPGANPREHAMGAPEDQYVIRRYLLHVDPAALTHVSAPADVRLRTLPYPIGVAVSLITVEPGEEHFRPARGLEDVGACDDLVESCAVTFLVCPLVTIEAARASEDGGSGRASECRIRPIPAFSGNEPESLGDVRRS